MKEFKCSDAGHACDWKARGDNDADIINKAKEHGKQQHGLNDVKDEQIQPLIHDIA